MSTLTSGDDDGDDDGGDDDDDDDNDDDDDGDDDGNDDDDDVLVTRGDTAKRNKTRARARSSPPSSRGPLPTRVGKRRQAAARGAPPRSTELAQSD